MKTKQVLIKIRKLLTNRRHWTKEAFAKNKFNAVVETDALDAVKWCLLGAIYKERGSYSFTTLYNVLMKCLPNDSNDSLGEFNDRTTTKHKDVLALLDRAIQTEARPK